MEYFIVVILSGTVAAFLASTKNRSPLAWFLLALFIGPFSLIVALFPAYEALEKRMKDIEYYVKQGKQSSYIASLLNLKHDEVITGCSRLLDAGKISQYDYNKVVPKDLAVKKCPYCAEQIKPDAKICKHCHKDLPK